MHSFSNQAAEVDSLRKEGQPGCEGKSMKTQILSNVLVILGIALVVAVILAFIGVLIHMTQTNDESSNVSQSANDSVGESTNEQKVCIEEDCIIVARDILTSMDHSKDPCEDFYKFACGRYDQHNQIGINHEGHSMISKMNNVMNASLKEILEQPINEGDFEVYTMARKFYKSCILQEKNKKEMHEKFMTISEEMLGAWPAKVGEWVTPPSYSWEKQVLGLMKLNMFPVFQLLITMDMSNLTKNAIRLMDPVFPSKILSKSNECNAFISSDEINLQNLKKAMSNVPNETSAFVWTTINELKSASPDVDWNTLLAIFPKSIYVNNNDSVLVDSWDHLKHILSVMVNASKRDMQNFLFDFANTQILMLAEKYSNIHPWWKNCIEETEALFPEMMSDKFAKKHYNKEKICMAENIIHEIRVVLIDKIEKATWLDNSTRKRALGKVRQMKINVGQPEEFFYDELLLQSYKKIKLIETEYPTNVQKLFAIRLTYYLSSLRKLNRRDEWQKQTWINAAYTPLKNSFSLPAAIFDLPLISLNLPAYLNYGRIGIWVGHEITHAFDAVGSQTNEIGNVENWWSNTSSASLQAKYNCFITQFNNTKDTETGCRLNGQISLKENTADTGATKLAYSAFVKWLSKNLTVPALPGLQKYTPKQLFFIAMATLDCAIYTKEKRINILEKDPHPIAEYRINFPLKNLAEFGDVFNCPKTAKMRLQDRCEMW